MGPKCPCKMGQQKDGCKKQQYRFDVSWPPCTKFLYPLQRGVNDKKKILLYYKESSTSVSYEMLKRIVLQCSCRSSFLCCHMQSLVRNES